MGWRRTAAPSPRCTPRIPSNFQVFLNASAALLYTLPCTAPFAAVPPTAPFPAPAASLASAVVRPCSSPSNCSRVFATGVMRISSQSVDGRWESAGEGIGVDLPSTENGNRQLRETTARGRKTTTEDVGRSHVLGFVTVTAHDAASAPLRNISISPFPVSARPYRRAQRRTRRRELRRGRHGDGTGNKRRRTKESSPENSGFSGFSARFSARGARKCGTTHSMQATDGTTVGRVE